LVRRWSERERVVDADGDILGMDDLVVLDVVYFGGGADGLERRRGELSG